MLELSLKENIQVIYFIIKYKVLKLLGYCQRDLIVNDDVLNGGKDPIIESVLRTPDVCFNNLPDFEFEEHYATSSIVKTSSREPIRIHYIDEGDTNSPIILLLHGMMSSSYGYRKIIPLLSENFRVIAIDMVGFGKSDKPSKRTDYSYKRQVDWLYDIVEQLDLNDINVYCNDWGGLTGLRMVAMHPERFSRLILATSFLPDGNDPQNVPTDNQVDFASVTGDLIPMWSLCANIVTVRDLSNDECRGYDAPFPSEKYKVGTRICAKIPPVSDDHPGVDENKQHLVELSKFEKPTLTIWGHDKNNKPEFLLPEKRIARFYQALIPGAKNVHHQIVQDANHWVHEDQPEKVAQIVTDFIIKGDDNY